MDPQGMGACWEEEAGLVHTWTLVSNLELGPEKTYQSVEKKRPGFSPQRYACPRHPDQKFDQSITGLVTSLLILLVMSLKLLSLGFPAHPSLASSYPGPSLCWPGLATVDSSTYFIPIH